MYFSDRGVLTLGSVGVAVSFYSWGVAMTLISIVFEPSIELSIIVCLAIVVPSILTSLVVRPLIVVSSITIPSIIILRPSYLIGGGSRWYWCSVANLANFPFFMCLSSLGGVGHSYRCRGCDPDGSHNIGSCSAFLPELSSFATILLWDCLGYVKGFQRCLHSTE